MHTSSFANFWNKGFVWANLKNFVRLQKSKGVWRKTGRKSGWQGERLSMEYTLIVREDKAVTLSMCFIVCAWILYGTPRRSGVGREENQYCKGGMRPSAYCFRRGISRISRELLLNRPIIPSSLSCLMMRLRVT